MSDAVAPSTWKLLLTDCYNASNQVKILTRNGKEFTGYVQKHPSKCLMNIIEIGDRYGQIIYSIDTSEIAVVTEMR